MKFVIRKKSGVLARLKLFDTQESAAAEARYFPEETTITPMAGTHD